MRATVTAKERAALRVTQAYSRHWRRYQAGLPRAEGVLVATVARTLD